jgi:hypothetical protein
MMKLLLHPVSAAVPVLLVLLWLCFCCCHCCFTGSEHMILHKPAQRGSNFNIQPVSMFVVQAGVMGIQTQEHQRTHPQQEHVMHQHQCSLTC